jgi:hypothetical protein
MLSPDVIAILAAWMFAAANALAPGASALGTVGGVVAAILATDVAAHKWPKR